MKYKYTRKWLAEEIRQRSTDLGKEILIDKYLLAKEPEENVAKWNCDCECHPVDVISAIHCTKCKYTPSEPIKLEEIEKIDITQIRHEARILGENPDENILDTFEFSINSLIDWSHQVNKILERK